MKTPLKHASGFLTITIISGLQKTLLQTNILNLLTEEIELKRTYSLLGTVVTGVGKVSVIPLKKECILIPEL